MMQLAVSHTPSSSNNLLASDEVLGDDTLCHVLSWLEVRELLGAGLVSRRWAAAASCKEVFRRRMHTHVLDSLFAPQPASTQRNQPPPPSDALAAAIAALAAAPADCTPDSSCTAVTPTCSPARLFAALYSSSLLANGSFLERLNVGKAAGGARQLAWEPTHHGQRGTTTWAHPFDFYPELCPLPGAGLLHHKPFSVGCLATATGAWSEVTQVVDVVAALSARGIPAATADWLLTAGLSLEFSVLVAGGAIAGGEYQVVVTLLSAADAASAANNQLPLSAVPRAVLPFGHPLPGSPGVAAVAATNLALCGLGAGSSVASRAPLQPAPGVWSRYSCRAELPRDAAVSHVVVALRGRATRNSRLGTYATKFADARLAFLTADQC